MGSENVWDAIGAIGEIGGAIAVVVTLVFLSRQLRENTKSMNAAAHTQRTQRNLQILFWNADHQVTDIRRRLESGREISAVENDVLTTFDSALLRHFEDMHYQWVLGVIDDETWNANLNGLRLRAANLDLDSALERWRPMLRGSFVEVLDELVADRDR